MRTAALIRAALPHAPAAWLLAALTLLAGALRLAVALATVDIPGDGPTRAALGWQWRLEPRLVRDGSWLPLGEVLVGLTSFLIPDPKWAARVLSLFTGTATVPLIGNLTAHLFTPQAGLVAAALLALLPIHIALSASSLIDAPALFFTLFALRLALAAPERDAHSMRLCAIALSGNIACGLRYEAWALVPLLTLHRWLATRSVIQAASLFLSLSVVAAFWLFAALGSPAGLLAAFAKVAASGESVGGYSVSSARALALVGSTLSVLLGPLTLALAAMGLIRVLTGAENRRIDRDIGLWLALLALDLLVLFLLARERGPSLVDRYGLSAVVLALPFAAQALARLVSLVWLRALAVLVLVSTTALVTWLTRPELYLARSYPSDVIALAGWLDRVRAPEAALVFTRAGWLPTYVPLFHPLRREDYRIVSWYLPEGALRAFLLRRKPQLLITRAGDEAFVARIQAAGASVGELLERFGRLEVRRLHLSDLRPNG